MTNLITKLKTLAQEEEVFSKINALHRKMETSQIDVTNQFELLICQLELKEILENNSFKLPENIRKKGEELLTFLFTFIKDCLGYYEKNDGVFITYPDGKIEVFKVENHPQILNSIGFCDDDDSTIEVIYGAYQGCLLKIYYADSPFPEEYESYPVHLINE